MTCLIAAIVGAVFVIIIVPLLIAIAIPTFLGASERAEDSAAQSVLRNALTGEQVFYTANREYTADPSLLSQIDNEIQ